MDVNINRLNERFRLTDLFKVLITQTAKERNKRPEMVKDNTGWHEPAWVLHEREVMCREVNRQREGRGRPPITVEDVAKVERCASGHVDYISKFALYCAEIVLNESPNVKPS